MEKNYSKYYTPVAVSTALVKLMNFNDNCSAIDICCGSGNLLSAAKQINNTIKCFGVDICKIFNDDINLIQDDGRSYAIKNPEKFDYSLANPPFGRSESKDYAHFLFSGKYKSIVSSRIEIEMLFANLCILKNTGTLLIILPTTVTEGPSTINVRKILAQNHFVSAIIDLPLNAFAPERIKCSALIIKKEPNNNLATTFYSMNTSFSIKELRKIPPADMLSGNWCGANSKNVFGFVICQGKVSSSAFRTSGLEVLHTGKRSTTWQPTIRFAQICNDKKYVMAEEGDIIISRIGISAGQKCIYHGKPRLISDCLLLIKSPDVKLTEQILKLDFKSLVTGLSTPHITAYSINQAYGREYPNNALSQE